ncbi:hypothetical protein N9N16_03935 [Porticoccaceae bacterium]|nr:hypothetical protein [Porticoccaceae bacterium]
MKFRSLMLLLMLLLIGKPAFATNADWGDGAQVAEPDNNPEPNTVIDRMNTIGELDTTKWGIRNGCISINRIRSISFKDDQSAIIDVSGRKQVLLRLVRECPGIRTQGFIYQVRGSQLCERFDRLKLVRAERVCEVQSLEPYIPVEEVKPKKAKRK